MKIRTKLGLGFGAQVLLAAVLGISALLGMAEVRRQFSIVVERDAPVIANARHLAKLVVDMETGQRGFVITGEETFLEPYTSGTIEFNALLEKEKKLVSDYPGQVAVLERIGRVVDEWKEKAAKPEIAMARKVAAHGIDAQHLQDVLGRGVGKRLIDEFMALGHELEVGFSGRGDWEGAFAVEIIEKCMADREDGQRGFLITGREEFLEKYNAGEQKKLPRYFARLRAIVSQRGRGDELSEKVDQLERLTREWTTEAAEPEIAARREMNANPESLKDVAALLEAGTGKALIDEIRREFDEFIKTEEERAAQSYADASQMTASTRNIAIALLVLATCLGVVVALMTSRVVTRPLAKLAQGAERVGSGDLQIRIEGESADEIGTLVQAFNAMASDLCQSQDRYKSLVNNIPGVTFRCALDADWTMHYMSAAAESLTGYPASDFIGNALRSFESVIHPEDSQGIHQAVNEAVAAGREWEIEYRLCHRDGSVRWACEKGRGVVGDDGQVAFLDGFILDITDRKRTKQAAAARSLELERQAIKLEKSRQAAMSIMEDAEKARALAEEAKSELSESNAMMIEALENEKRSAKHLEVAMDELESAKEAAEAATRSKSDFLANMSHEIRTPMTAILGFAENLLDVDLSASDKLNCVHTIHRNGEFLLSLINDILDLSKIEADKMTIERRDCTPCQVVAEVASLMRVRADAKKLPFHIQYIGAIPETIQSDSTRLRQILINLIGNAIKFTETGAVRLVISVVEGGDESRLQFDVIDSGRGMTEEQQVNLFQPFMQADTSTTRKFGGTGLGLTISKRFAELLGGDITVVETEIDGGSTFRATVATGSLDGVTMLDDPMSATVVAETAHAVAQVTQSDLHGLRILLAEDGPDNQRLISFVLKKAGADVKVEENGKLALGAALAASDEGNPFDVILMDMQMPVMDGYEATGQLRQKGYTGPIIALTAHAMDGDREKCINAGCDDFATKPIDRKKLIETIRQNLVRAEATSAAAT